MNSLQQLASQLNELYQRASVIDSQRKPGKPQDWFESGLFSWHSPDLTDYVADTQRNLNRLATAPDGLSQAARQRLAEHVNAQVNALTRAFYNLRTRDKSHISKVNTEQRVKPVNNQPKAVDLYQQLTEYQQFERRLQDMIEQADRYGGKDNADRLLALHGRLGRCRKAISDTEQAILIHERQLPL